MEKMGREGGPWGSRFSRVHYFLPLLVASPSDRGRIRARVMSNTQTH